MIFRNSYGETIVDSDLSERIVIRALKQFVKSKHSWGTPEEMEIARDLIHSLEAKRIVSAVRNQC